MIPLRDDIPSRTIPWVNYILIALCALAFFAQETSTDQSEGIVAKFAMVPLRLSDPNAVPVIDEQRAVQTPRGIEVVHVQQKVGPSPLPPWLTLVTCMFLHGGWMHFLGNMWFLYIFGDNVEDRFGHLGFTILYLGTGILAGLSHYFSAPNSPIPTLGASGAIAGVMGAYAYLYPHARVLTLLPLIVIFTTIVVPAPIFLGLWFLLQLYSGVGSLVGEPVAGVAWWAHAGGFVAGIVAAIIVSRLPIGSAPMSQRRF